MRSDKAVAGDPPCKVTGRQIVWRSPMLKRSPLRLARLLLACAVTLAAHGLAQDIDLKVCRTLTETGQWEKAAALVRDYTLDDVRDASGRPAVVEMLEYLKPEYTTRFETWDQCLGGIESSRVDDELRPWLVLIKANLLNGLALKRRGSTPDLWSQPKRRKAWHETSAEAFAILEAVPREGRTLPWYYTWLTVARGLQLSDERVMEVAREAMQRVAIPDYPLNAAVSYFSPQWHGDADKMLAVIDELASLLSDQATRSLCLSSAYWAYFTKVGQGGVALVTEDRKREIISSFDARVARYPSALVKDARAFVACLLGDQKRAAAWFRESKTPVTNLWSKTEWSYVDWRRWALGEQTDDEEKSVALAKALVGRWRKVDYIGAATSLTPEYFRKNRTVTTYTADGRMIEEYYLDGPERPSGMKTWEYRIVSPSTYEYRKPGGEWWQRHVTIVDGHLQVKVVGGPSTFIYEREEATSR